MSVETAPLFVERDGALAVRRGSLRGEVSIARGEQPAWAGLRRQCAVARLLDDVAFELHFQFVVARDWPGERSGLRNFTPARSVCALSRDGIVPCVR